MGFINALAVIVFCLSGILFFIGMIKPEFLKLKNRKQATLITIVMLIASLIVFSKTSSDEQKAQIKQDIENSAKEKELLQKEKQDKLNKEKELEELEKINQLKNKVNLTKVEGSEELITNVLSALDIHKNNIEKTELANNSLDIYLKVKTVWNEEQIVSYTGLAAADIISKLKEIGVSDLKLIRMHASAELLDQYNNKFNNQVFFIEYDYPEALKLNSDSSALYQFYLRFSKMNIKHSVGRKAFNSWCNNETNVALSGSFCSKAN